MLPSTSEILWELLKDFIGFIILIAAICGVVYLAVDAWDKESEAYEQRSGYDQGGGR